MSARRVRLIVLDGVEPERELGVCGALLEDPGEGALVAARLCGAGLALGRWQPGPSGALRRWTGGRATHFGDGIAALAAIAPGPQAWLDERAPLAGPRLLNRWARGLLAGLGAMGVQASYPGRDFAAANGRQVASLGLERTRAGHCLFHALIGLRRACPAEADPAFPGLPAYPPASSVAGEGGDPDALRALARGFAQRFGLELVESEPPSEAGLPPDPGADAGPPVQIPIGRLRARVERDASGRIARARLLGDWIAASADVETLEGALAGADPDAAAALEALAARWLALPGAIAIGVTAPRQIAAAVQAAARQ